MARTGPCPIRLPTLAWPPSFPPLLATILSRCRLLSSHASLRGPASLLPLPWRTVPSSRLRYVSKTPRRCPFRASSSPRPARIDRRLPQLLLPWSLQWVLLQLAGAKSRTYAPDGTCTRLSVLRIAGYGTAVLPSVAPPHSGLGLLFRLSFSSVSVLILWRRPRPAPPRLVRHLNLGVSFES